MSFPTYNMAKQSGPGFLYVNAKITDPSLSPELFTKWYQDIHIPDIFETKEILSAFRYYTTSSEKVDRPYLALYPVEDVGFLQTDKFRNIPVYSDILPGDGLIFDYADFDIRYYTHVKTKSKARHGKCSGL